MHEGHKPVDEFLLLSIDQDLGKSRRGVETEVPVTAIGLFAVDGELIEGRKK